MSSVTLLTPSAQPRNLLDRRSDREPGVHDDVVLRLQELRRRAGEPSYAEISRLVAAARIVRGVPDAAALPARTTVYDAFRIGRRRLDRELVADLMQVLEQEARRLAPVEVAPAIEPEAPAAPSGGVTWRQRLVLLEACVLVNLVGLVLIDALGIPLWLDMVGTAVAAVALGPWWGVGMALVSSGLDGALTGGTAFWFTPVAVCAALVWGVGVRRFGMARDLRRFFALTLLVGVACTALAAPITWLVFDGFTSHDPSDVTEILVDHVPWLPAAVLMSNLTHSLLDKLVVGFAALVILDVLAARWPWLERVLRGGGPGPVACTT